MFLQDFIIGSSWLVFIQFFVSVFYGIKKGSDGSEFSGLTKDESSGLTKNESSGLIRTYSDRQYAIIAPLYLGLLFAIGGLFRLKGLSRLLVTTILSIIGVTIFVYQNDSYVDLDWSRYIPRLAFKHLFSYSIALWIKYQIMI